MVGSKRAWNNDKAIALPPEKRAGSIFEGLKVLIVEDNQSTLQIMRRLLQDMLHCGARKLFPFLFGTLYRTIFFSFPSHDPIYIGGMLAIFYEDLRKIGNAAIQRRVIRKPTVMRHLFQKWTGLFEQAARDKRGMAIHPGKDA